MTTTFDQDSSRDYEFTHGRRPRGVGDWSFSLHRNGASTQFAVSGSFTAARREALREARSLGCDTVTVNT
jgi:hypothetical protein